MSDEKRIFTHPGIEQARNFATQYNEKTRLMICSVCHEPWSEHSGWACGDQPTLTTLPERPATVTTTCARCSATVDPDTVERHHERCFVVGDDVVTRYGGEVRGRIASVIALGCFVVETVAGVKHAYGAPALRRIQEPMNCYRGGPCNMPASGGPCVDCGYPRAYARAEDMSAALEVDAVYVGGTALEIIRDRQMTPGFVRVVQRKNYEHVDYPVRPPARVTVTYDGLTAEQCLQAYVYRQRDGEDRDTSDCPTISDGRPLTPEQLSAARELWSQQLRAAVDARREQERCAVMMPIDAEDLPW